jgi:hypothetical protein
MVESAPRHWLSAAHEQRNVPLISAGHGRQGNAATWAFARPQTTEKPSLAPYLPPELYSVSRHPIGESHAKRNLARVARIAFLALGRESWIVRDDRF